MSKTEVVWKIIHNLLEARNAIYPKSAFTTVEASRNKILVRK